MRCRARSLLALFLAGGLLAQGTINPTLLRVAADEATSPARSAGSAGLVAKVRGSVVWVAVEVDRAAGNFFARASSGVIVDPSGLVVTWGHLVQEVVDDRDRRLLVQLDDAANTQLPATIVRVDAGSGLALLRVVPPAGGLQAAVVGGDTVAPGEPVLVLARPQGKEMLAWAGVASASLASVTLHGRAFAPAELILTDTRNDERGDGAPVFDAQGRLSGLYASEHVLRDRPEPTLEELKMPSFGVVVPAGRLRRAFAAEFAAVANPTLQRAAPAGPEHQQVTAVRAIAPSVVSVWAGDGEWPQLGSNDPGGVVRRPGLGSGVVLSRTGLVVANAHVVDVGPVRVRLADGRTFAASVVKKSSAYNLALLQLELPTGVALQAADCNGDGDAILGEVVLAVGNPLGSQVVVTAGVVSALRLRDGSRIQADANLGNQNGGGAVVAVNGRLLGIGDAGVVDPVDVQYAMRGDRVSAETNLSTFVSIARVRKAFAEALAKAPPDEPVRARSVTAEAERRKRESALTAMVANCAGAMLNVYIAKNMAVPKETDLFPPEPQWQKLFQGSGVIIDPSGLAISNWHVVDEATRPDGSMVADHKVTALAFGGKEYAAKVLSISREHDLSLLQLELAAGQTVPAVQFGSSEALSLGEAVAAIGNPHGQENSITFGVVTAKGQSTRVRGRHAKLEPLIETDAAINGGNSGGALLDLNGRLVGINTAGGGTFNNKGFAIEVDHVRRQVLTLLFAAYKLRSPDLGLRVIDDDGKVLVLDTDLRGPAAEAGVRSGDRIVALNDTPITWSPGWAMQLLQQQPGADVTLHLERGGAPMALRVKPLPAAAWAVVRQSGLLVRDFAFAENPDRVQAAAIAFHRQTTGDAQGTPPSLPEQMVVVDRVFPGEQPVETDVRAGDFVLAVELLSEGGGEAIRQVVTGVEALRDLWNDRKLGDYDGLKWKCWIARGAEVKQVEIRSRRLFW